MSLRQREQLWAYAFLTVPLLFFIFIRMAPALFAFNVSLREWGILSNNKPFVGLQNFAALMGDEVFWQSMKNSLLYVVVGVPLVMTLGLAIALLIQQATRFSGIYRTLYFIPYVTSAVAVSWVWKWMYQKHIGLFNQLLLRLDLPQMGFLQDPSTALYSIVAVIVWQALGFQILIFVAGLETIPETYYDAARIDGANGWQLFRYVTLPLLNPTVVFLVVISSIRLIQVFTEVQNMSPEGEGGPLNSTISIVLYIYRLAFRNFRMGYASAATVVLFLLIMGLTLLQMRVLTKRFEY